MAYVYLAIAIVAEVIGTSALNASNGFTRAAPTAVVVTGYLIAFYFLSLTLKTMPVAIAYAIWSGVGIALITTIGWVFFKQILDAAALLGIAMIVAGVVVINLFSVSARH
jgi:small multidrug resistance pump